MIRPLFVAWFIACVLVIACPPATYAARPHWATCPTRIDEGTMTVSGKIAGLGTKQTTDLEVTILATALCIDLAVEPPATVASLPVSATIGIAPAKGHVTFTIDLTPMFAPPCDDPLEVVFTTPSICETTPGEAIGCCGKTEDED
jgi:hypothetical protein